MPRKSELTKLKEQARTLLNDNEVRTKIHYNTYYSYDNEISSKTRKDTINRIIDELNAVKNMNISKITKDEIKKSMNRVVSDEEIDVKATKFTTNFLTKRLIKFENVPNRLEALYKNIRSTIKRYKNTKDKYGQPLLGKNKTFSIILFMEREENKVDKIELNFTMSADNMGLDEKDFKKAFEKFENKIKEFSKEQSENYESLDFKNIITDKFRLNIINIGKAKGSSTTILFNTVGIVESKIESKGKGRKKGKGDCVYQCLKNCGIDYEGNFTDLQNIDFLIDYIKKNQLPIDLLCNSFIMKNDIDVIFNRKNNKFINAKINKKDQDILVAKMELSDIELVYLNKNENSQYTILYDEFNQHADIITNNEVVIKDIYISRSLKVFYNNEMIFSPFNLSMNNNTDNRNNKMTIEYVFFDYETVVDYKNDSCMQEYSISLLHLTKEELKQLKEADENKDFIKVNEIRKNKCKTFMGFDCSEYFIQWIMKNQGSKRFVLIGYNNASFDNLILMHALLRFKKHNGELIDLSNIFYNGNTLLNMYINNRHSMFDLHKHLAVGSLASNCESFRINCCSKKSFDHDKAQLLFENGELLNFINNNEELKEYNEYDVLATAVLFEKYRQTLANNIITSKYADELFNTPTIGSLVYKIFSKSIIDKKINLPNLDTYDKYKDLQRSKVAGRVELFNGVKKIQERIVSTDVCSLYPYVMSIANVYYPCGEIIETNEYIESTDKIGFYYCDIDQSNLKNEDLPLIYPFKTGVENNWNHEGKIENYLLSNVMIDLLLKYNCKVEIKNGWFFTEKRKSCDMFDFILQFMSMKNEQDRLSNENPELYNPALRETLKLLMNSLSGKVIEGLHLDKTVAVDTLADYEKYTACNELNTIDVINNKIFISYKCNEEEVFNSKKKQKPWYLGVLIYDYAKTYMYEMSYSKIGKKALLYTDTDASKFRYDHKPVNGEEKLNDFMSWKKWIDDSNVQVPHWEEVEQYDPRYANHKIYQDGSKVFGSFEDELAKMKGGNYTFYCLQKKTWLYNDGQKTKYKFKGLNNNCLLLNNNSIADKNNEQLAEYFRNNKNDNIGKNSMELFDRCYKKKEAYVLCQSFRKIVKNSMRNVGIDDTNKYNKNMNCIKVCYSIKHIKITN
jgi:hypothetical protein